MAPAATPADVRWLWRASLAISACGGALAAHLRPPTSVNASSYKHKSSVPHVTYFVFEGREESAMAEFTLSGYSLCRNTPSAEILVVTDQPEDAEVAIKKLNKVCWHGKEQASYAEADGGDLEKQFHKRGFSKLLHEAGVGAYAKVFAEELIPKEIERTIVVDTDTVFNQDITDMWGKFADFSSMEVLSAKPTTMDKKCFGQGERLNLGLVMMELSHMRKANWSSNVLTKVTDLAGKDKSCGHCVEGKSLLCGDGDLVSYACKKIQGRCGQLEPWYHANYCNDPEDLEPADGWDHKTDPMLFHFNCGDGYKQCPGAKCKELVDEFFDNHVNPFSRSKL